MQIVLRLYNSPAEVLMGFDVDACACGYDGSRVYVCPRTAMAFAYQANLAERSTLYRILILYISPTRPASPSCRVTRAAEPL